MANAKVDWFGEEVLLLLGEATQEGIEEVAFQIEGQTKANITANNQIDTGFMRNSVYVVLSNGDNYSAASAAAKSKNPGGVMAPKASLQDGAKAAVAVGASYSIWQELKQSFVLRAVEQVAGQVAEAEIQKVARKRGLI